MDPTAIALITFGFTIYKFFQLELPGHVERSHLGASRVCDYTGRSGSHFFLSLISLAFATLEHGRSQRVLRQQWSDAPRSSAVWLAAMISILGTLALLAMIFHR